MVTQLKHPMQEKTVMWNKFRATALVAALLAGTAAIAYAQSSATLEAGGSTSGGSSASTTLGSGGRSSGSTLGTGGSTAGRTNGSGSSSTMGTAGSSAGSSTGMTQRNAHRWHHGTHMGSTRGNRNAPGLH